MPDELVTGSGEAAPTTTAPAVAPTPATFAPPVATPQAPQAPATGAIPDGYVPSYRLREAREAAESKAQQTYAQQLAQIRAEADQYREQLHRLVGVGPQPNPEVDTVRQQFAQLYPGLSRIEERAAQVEQLLERAGDLESQTNHYWTTYGRQTMDKLFEHAQTSLGSPLTEEGKRMLHSSFVGWVQSSPEMTARYAQDPSIVEDFWKGFTSGFIDPARRVASATVTGRTQSMLPQDSPGGALHVTPAPAPANMDERLAPAWQMYNQNKR